MSKPVTPSTTLSTAARALLTEITTAGEARIKGRSHAATELERAGLIRAKKGSATLTRAGRWATAEQQQIGGAQ